jgi:hypothetical protein
MFSLLDSIIGNYAGGNIGVYWKILGLGIEDF